MENPVKPLLSGNWLMAVCGIFYLAWWVIVFRPPKPRSTPAGAVLLTLAFLTGIAGFYIMTKALTSPVTEARPGIRGIWIVAAGAVLYAVLLAGTSLIFHRQVTSELLIITAWATLELCTLSFLYRCRTLNPGGSVLLAAVVFTAAAASLVCYLLYYRLPYTAGYIDGCIPLVLAIVTIAAINLTTAHSL